MLVKLKIHLEKFAKSYYNFYQSAMLKYFFIKVNFLFSIKPRDNVATRVN